MWTSIVVPLCRYVPYTEQLANLAQQTCHMTVRFTEVVTPKKYLAVMMPGSEAA